jgi:hypothetical protein
MDLTRKENVFGMQYPGPQREVGGQRLGALASLAPSLPALARPRVKGGLTLRKRCVNVAGPA